MRSAYLVPDTLVHILIVLLFNCNTMCQERNQPLQDLTGENQSSERTEPHRWKLYTFLCLLLLDGVSSVLLTCPFFFWSTKYEGATHDKYTLYGTLYDLGILAIIRLVFCIFSIIFSYCSGIEDKSPFELYHRNGDRKSREELENEALEEAWSPWIKRYFSRPAFPAEVIGLITGVGCIVKCLARLSLELGAFHDAVQAHPLFWITLLLATAFAWMECSFLDSISKLAGECGRYNRKSNTSGGLMRRIGSNLSIPLLSSVHDDADDNSNGVQNEDGEDAEQGNDSQPDDVRATSDITADTTYKAKWTDLLAITCPDLHLIAFAFIFLLLAAAAQIYIPTFTGRILDSLAEVFSGDHQNDNAEMSIWDVPGFISNVIKLLVASVLCGVFSGLRGSIFTVVGGRANVRLRVKLMDSLFAQDIGFFDVTKTGDITSRLSSDTTLVGDQVTLNVNVFLRSFVQVVGFLIFMFMLSWQLSLLAFISVPVITSLSKLYGNYIRSLTKLMQKKLADGNSISEAALGSMSTVRAFDAAESELLEFEGAMKEYLTLNIRNAVAYFGYATCVTSLPNLVTAVVLFYGGLLVRNGDLTSGELVSFLLYLQSLSDAFASIGYIFSSLTQAVGAADKVMELLNRNPNMKTPSNSDEEISATRNSIGVKTTRTRKQRLTGLHPTACEGNVELKGVEMYYPARPNRKVLDNLSLSIPKGSVVALVGPSGSGKSSVMSLVQHLYEPSSGRIMIDGNDVHELSPEWLSRHVSVVSQEPTLFARSIAKNIMYGLEGTGQEPTLEDIKEAARLANAHSFIEKLPFGYDTDVGERGVQLSGGQKQRIAIARALVRKPRILLLDEATSALDAESEALVQEAIDDMLARGRGEEAAMTVLIVAHRLSTVRNADKIFVVQDGKVEEEGSHDELIADQDGAYSNLVCRQMNAQNKLENKTS